MKVLVGNVEYELPDLAGVAKATMEFIQTEENRVLSLGQCGVTADEDILIHLVRMYAVRWALPVVEIELGGHLDLSAMPVVQSRFWLCMLGRAADDLHDRDSRFFSLADSILLTLTYSALLNLEPTSDRGADILKRTAKSLAPWRENSRVSPLTMADIRQDVCRRVDYFLSPPSVNSRAAELVNRYVGVLLGRCDLEDCLADGASGVASTTISRDLHRQLADPEGKIHLNSHLIQWYDRLANLLENEAESLWADLQDFGATYAARIVRNTFFHSQANSLKT